MLPAWKDALSFLQADSLARVRRVGELRASGAPRLAYFRVGQTLAELSDVHPF